MHIRHMLFSIDYNHYIYNFISLL